MQSPLYQRELRAPPLTRLVDVRGPFDHAKRESVRSGRFARSPHRLQRRARSETMDRQSPALKEARQREIRARRRQREEAAKRAAEEQEAEELRLLDVEFGAIGVHRTRPDAYCSCREP